MNQVNIDRDDAPVAGASATPEGSAGIDAAALTNEQLADLKQRAAKAEEHWDRLLRTTADFDNFRKRSTREKQEAIKFANEALLEKLVPVLDNFDIALAAAQDPPSDSARSFLDGVAMIFQQFKQVLVDSGLEEINAVGKPFDPNLHEAVAQKEAADVPEGQVLQQLRKGYRLRERLIRPASVIVAKAP